MIYAMACSMNVSAAAYALMHAIAWWTNGLCARFNPFSQRKMDQSALVQAWDCPKIMRPRCWSIVHAIVAMCRLCGFISLRSSLRLMWYAIVVSCQPGCQVAKLKMSINCKFSTQLRLADYRISLLLDGLSVASNKSLWSMQQLHARCCELQILDGTIKSGSHPISLKLKRWHAWTCSENLFLYVTIKIVKGIEAMSNKQTKDMQLQPSKQKLGELWLRLAGIRRPATVVVASLIRFILPWAIETLWWWRLLS